MMQFEKISDGCAAVTYGKDEKGAVIIPGTVEVNGESLKVTAVARHAFSDNAKITSVRFPITLKRVMTAAFRGCSRLVLLAFVSEDVWIGLNAFQYCESLKNIICLKPLDVVQSYAFYGCKSLSTVFYSGDIAEPKRGISVLGNQPFRDALKVRFYTGSEE